LSWSVVLVVCPADRNWVKHGSSPSDIGAD
jgi:hypothetical protein